MESSYGPLDQLLQLMTPEEALRLASGALDILSNQIHHEDRFEDHPRKDAVMWAAKMVFECGMALASMRGDRGVLPMIMRALQLGDYAALERSDYLAISEALTELASTYSDADAEIERLAARPEPIVRGAIACGLTPTGPRSMALLRRMAREDADPQVRIDARDRLATVETLPWWEGKFSQDPIARLRPDEVANAEPALRRFAEIIEKGQALESIPEIVGFIPSLPDVLRLEVAEQVYRTPRYGVNTSLATAIVNCNGFPRWLTRMLDRWFDEEARAWGGGDVAKAALDAASDAVRAETCPLLLERALDFDGLDGERAAFSPQYHAADYASRYWPPTLDPSPYLERLLERGAPKDSEGAVYFAVGKVMARADVGNFAFLPRVIEALFAGFPGEWEHLRHSAAGVLGKLPFASRRELATRALDSGKAKAIEWGVEQLTSSSYDRAVDGDPHSMVGRWFQVPSVRDAIVKRRYPWALPHLRERLRAGVASLEEAAATIQLIGKAYGGAIDVFRGLIDTSHVDGRADPSRRTGDEDESDAAPVASQGDGNTDPSPRPAEFRGPAELRGPPSAAEWAALRRIRSQVSLEQVDMELLEDVCLAIPDHGPWEPSDRAAFEVVIRRQREDRDDHIHTALAAVFVTRGTVDDLPLLDVAIAATSDYPRRVLRTVRKRFAMDESAAPPDETAGPEKEWMDKDDE